ncbi:acyl-CoA dehydrogenase [Streptomyces platensis]|uniref:Acyl-CoA dehydrogenase n=1 Tax=Streptomyces platensis TaxID=58346 RepID=A0AAE6NK03_STRPT|nr:acyl-CoA dehydrogenase family protein [Streptomyces platensis]OSY45792.1 Acyl-CoA dehydrogenase [Streptomyces platensis]QEV53696.1 acyl-CoA dehydrogenase [Streptomyces platensis]
MDFTPTPEQTAARELAAEIFGDLSTPERLAAGGSGTDAALWKALCAAGLPGAAEETGLLGLVLMLEEQGRTTAQVPFAATCVYGLLAIGAHGSAEQRARLLPPLRTGEAVATGAFPARHGGVRAEGTADGTADLTANGTADGTADPTANGTGRLTGVVPVVPWLCAATHVLVPDGATRTLWLVRTDAPGVRRDPVETTAPWSAGRLTLDGAPAERLGPDTPAEPLAADAPAERLAPPAPAERLVSDAYAYAYADILALARTAFAGLQAGVAAGSLARAVAHTTTREQFGRPLSTNQGVLLRAADAHMDIEAIRVTAYEAAWRRDAGLDAGPHALTAAWWASEAGTRVVHTGQHLHGGIGADLDHPVHRHFLWGRQLAGYLGPGAEILEQLGELLTGERPATTGSAEPADRPAFANDSTPAPRPTPSPRTEAP